MKFDKETIIAIVLCAVFLIGWEPFCRKMGWIQPRRPAASDSAEKTVPAATAKEKTRQDGNALHSAKEFSKKISKGIVRGIPREISKFFPDSDFVEPAPTVRKLPLQKLETKNCIYEFDPQRGCIARITLKKFLNARKSAAIVLDSTPAFQPGALALGTGAKPLEILESRCPNEKSYRLVRRLRTVGGMEIKQTLLWEAVGDYTLDYSFSVTVIPGKGNSLPSTSSGKGCTFGICIGEMASWSRLSGDLLRTDPHEFAVCSPSGDCESFDVATKKEEKLQAISEKEMRWAAITNKYFALILMPSRPLNFYAHRLLLEQNKNFYSGTLKALFNIGEFRNGMDFSARFRYYAGPKESQYLKKFDPAATQLITYAWGPINGLAKGLLWILERLNDCIGSYGWSIVILTLMVRLVFFPLTMKGNASMQKMSKVQPRIKELKEKYKDTPQIFNAKMVELYKTEGINPMGGCLPILVQIPVFFALYAALDGALQLRQVPFLWSPDLAGPDTVWSCALPFSFFGIAHIHLNPLALAMTALMVVQQRIVPNSMEPAQQKMMAFMPLFMLLFLYELPSGLTLYWTVSNIFSILQMLWQQRQSKIAAAATGA